MDLAVILTAFEIKGRGVVRCGALKRTAQWLEVDVKVITEFYCLFYLGRSLHLALCFALSLL